MGLKQRFTKYYACFRSLVHVFKYGGFQKAEISIVRNGSILKNRVALVTGGSKGIGLAIARKFLDEGAKVIITGRNLNTLNNVKKQISNNNLYVVEWDVSKVALIDSKVRELEAMVNSEIDILVNNAGIYCTTQFPNCTPEDWDRVYNTNSKGCYFLCQYFCNKWKDKPNITRKIVNISSQGGFVGANNAYRMTKWDIRGLTKFLGITMSRYGIIVNGIAPGLILTDMQKNFKNQGDNIFTYLNPENRLGLPEEIAELSLYLASNSSNFIVGQTICCDGGYTLNN